MTDCTCDTCRSAASERQDALKMLEEHHNFPCVYMFKVIGFHSDDLVQEVRRAAEAVLGPITGEGEVRSRPSAGGKYLAVTVDTRVETPEQVLDIYDGLKALDGLVMVA